MIKYLNLLFLMIFIISCENNKILTQEFNIPEYNLLKSMKCVKGIGVGASGTPSSYYKLAGRYRKLKNLTIYRKMIKDDSNYVKAMGVILLSEYPDQKLYLIKFAKSVKNKRICVNDIGCTPDSMYFGEFIQKIIKEKYYKYFFNGDNSIFSKDYRALDYILNIPNFKSNINLKTIAGEYYITFKNSKSLTIILNKDLTAEIIKVENNRTKSHKGKWFSRYFEIFLIWDDETYYFYYHKENNSEFITKNDFFENNIKLLKVLHN